MAPTDYQKIAVDYVPALGPDGYATAPALDYARLRSGGFGIVYFRPEDHAHGFAAGPETVAARIRDLRNTGGLDGGIWFADPMSADSAAFGIPSDPTQWGNYVAEYVSSCQRGFGERPTVLVLNVEFSGKGLPPSKRNANYPAWTYCVEGGKLYQTQSSGITAATKPAGLGSTASTVRDGTVTWILVDPNYQYAKGWDWNEKAAVSLYANLGRLGLGDQKTMVQPMGEEDFNYGAWYKRGARVSPQCYGDQPYNAVTPDVLQRKVDLAVNNFYVPLFNNGMKVDERLVHPTIGAYGQGLKYVPQIKEMRKDHLFGFTLYPAGSLGDTDYTDYRQFVI